MIHLFKSFLIVLLVFFSASFTYSQIHVDNEGAWVLGSGEIVDAAYSPDGKYIATVGSLGVLIWDAESLTVANSYPTLQNMNELKWSPNRQKLYVADIFKLSNYGSFVINLESQQIIEIQEKASWLFNIFYNDLYKIPMHNNNLNFSYDANKLLIITLEDQISIYNLNNGSIEETIESVDDKVFAAGFMSNSVDVWYSTSRDFYFPDNSDFVKYTLYQFDRKTKLSTPITSFEERLFRGYFLRDTIWTGLTNDDKIAIRSHSSSPSIGLVNHHNHAYPIGSENSFSISNAGALLSEGMISFYPNRYQYQPHNNRFVSLAPNDITNSVIEIADIEQATSKRVISFNVQSIFTQPIHENKTTFLIGDFIPTEPPDSPAFGPVFPNYSLYEINWDDIEYEHLLPKTAPEIISFKPGETTQFFTFTSRKTNQYKYAVGRRNPDQELPLISNKFSKPFSQFWSPGDQTEVNVVLDKPFYDVGDFSADGNRFASPVGNGEGQINIWDTNTWETAHELMLDSTVPIHHIGFSPNDELFVSTQNTVDLWDTNSGERVIQFRGNNFLHADFSPDSTKLLTAGENGDVTEWDIGNLPSFRGTAIVDEAEPPIVFVNYLNDKSALYVLDDGLAKVIDLQSRTVFRQFNANLGNNSFRSIKVSPDKRYLFVGNEVWNLTSGKKITTIAENAHPILDLQLSNDGVWLTTRHSDFTARVWQTALIVQDQSAVRNYSIYH